MVKKTIEISQQCDLDFVLLVYDKKFNRFREIYTNPHLTLEHVDHMLKGALPPPNRAQDRVQGVRARDKLPKYRKEFAHDIVKVEEDKSGNQRGEAN